MLMRQIYPSGSQKKAGVAISYATEAVKILSSLFYTPVMLRLLGSSEYGLYQLVHSVVSYLGLLSLGFGAAYIRFYSRSKAQNDNEKIAKLNGMFLTIFSILSAICLICGIVMIRNIEGIFGTGLTGDEMGKARILMTLMVVNLALTFPNVVFNNSITAHERFVFQKSLSFLQALLNPFLTLPLLLMGYGSVAMVVVATVLTIGVLGSNIYYCLAKLRIRFLFRGFDWRLFREMFVFTFFLFLNQIIDQINWNIDKFFLGRMINTTAVAVYGIGALLNTLYIQLSTSISNVFVPQINRIVAEDNDNHKLTMLFAKVGRVQFLVLALILTGIIFLGQPFLKIWAGEGYENAYYVALLLMIPGTVPLIQNLGIEIQRAKNMHRARSVVYFFMAIANIFISILLIRHYGEIGAAAGTALSLFAANIGFMNWYYYKKIKLGIPYYWKQILLMSKGLVIPVLVGIGILYFIDTSTIFRLFLVSILYGVVYSLSMWFFGMNAEEKLLGKNIFHKR